MRRIGLGIILGLLAGMSHAAPQGHFVLDPGHTYPNFTIDHMGFSLMHGRFNESEGELVINADGSGRLEVRIDAASIDTGHDKRDEHLRGEDFFQVEKYPELRYESTAIKILDDQRAVVEGELSLLGVKKPVTLNVDRIQCGVHHFTKVYVCGFNATGRLQRSDFGMTYGLGSVGDEVTLRIEVEAFRQDDKSGLRKGPR